MLRAILMVLLAVVSTGAMAKWMQIGGNGIINTYAETSTVKKDGHRVKMWNMIDFKTAQRYENNVWLSQQAQHEYDCEKKEFRQLYVKFYSEHGGRGRLIYSITEPDKWESVPKNILEDLWRLACGKWGQ